MREALNFSRKDTQRRGFCLLFDLQQKSKNRNGERIGKAIITVSYQRRMASPSLGMTRKGLTANPCRSSVGRQGCGSLSTVEIPSPFNAECPIKVTE